MKMVVASGKGGTGKSMIASSLSLLFSEIRKVVACDCDVDAPNLGLWLGVEAYDSREKISVSEKATINPDKCINCGRCFEACRFEAIEKGEKYYVNPLTCEGCGVCKLVCPVDAVELEPVMNGEIRVKETSWGFPLVSGQVYPGATGSGKIVQRLRSKAEEFDNELMILDAAAGIGCPVIASVTNCDFAVLVTEPTPSGFSDLHRIIKIVNHFQIPFGLIINKYNINHGLSKEIEDRFSTHMLGKISYDRRVIDSIVNLKPVITSKSKVTDEIKAIFKRLEDFIQEI